MGGLSRDDVAQMLPAMASGVGDVEVGEILWEFLFKVVALDGVVDCFEVLGGVLFLQGQARDSINDMDVGFDRPFTQIRGSPHWTTLVNTLFVDAQVEWQTTAEADCPDAKVRTALETALRELYQQIAEANRVRAKLELDQGELGPDGNRFHDASNPNLKSRQTGFRGGSIKRVIDRSSCVAQANKEIPVG